MNESSPRFASLRECFWFCLTSIMPQSCGLMPKNLSSKLAVGLVALRIRHHSGVRNLGPCLTLDHLDQ